MDFKDRIIELLAQHGIAAEQLLEIPPDPKLGDYALPCFTLAKERKKAPPQIAQELAGKLHAEFLQKVVATGPYVNFFLRPDAVARHIVTGIAAGGFWRLTGEGRRILIEYPSPNTNKPLHLGHVRNMVLGSTLAIILKKDGNEIIQVNLNNDRGVHICKSMLAYQKWGDGREPDKKSDHFVGDYYVLFAKEAQKDPKLEEEAQFMLQQWEQGDPEVRELWRTMNDWALSGFRQTYERYGISFDNEYYESDIYEDGKRIVLERMDVFRRDDKGGVIAPLEQYGLPDKVVLRSDGTSVYMTQDIALTLRKTEDYDPDLQIWVVANEQNLHFQQLFAILELLGIKKRESLIHLSYGMVALPEGRMKSREGNVVDADDILDEVERLAADEIRKRRTEWPQEKITATARTVALGAIRFFMIKYDPMRDFIFDPNSSLSFEGDTGPYLQYTHARICSILAKEPAPAQADLALLAAPEEQELLRQLGMLPGAFRKAVDELKPSAIAMQLLEVGRAFNSFYHACPVLTAPAGVKEARLQLIDAVRQAIAQGLELLGISAPQEM